MPLFDFLCRACGNVFEALVRPNAEAPVCPTCKSSDLEKQMTTTFAVSSAERTQAAAKVQRAKAAAQGGRDNITREQEMNEHRKEDH